MKKNLRNILVLAMGLMTTVSFAQDWNVDSRTRIDMGGDYDKMETAQRATVGATWGGSDWSIHASSDVNYIFSDGTNGTLSAAVYEAYASTNLMGYASLTAGRQALEYGSGNIIGSNQWAAKRFTRDAFVFGLDLSMADVTLGYMNVMDDAVEANGGTGYFINASKADGDWNANLLYGSQTMTAEGVDGDAMTYMGLDAGYSMMGGSLDLTLSYNTVGGVTDDAGDNADMDMMAIGATYNVNDGMSIHGTYSAYGENGFSMYGGNAGVYGTDSWMTHGNMGNLGSEQNNLSLGGAYAMGDFNVGATMHSVSSDLEGAEDYERNAMEVSLGYTMSANAGLSINYVTDNYGTEEDTKYTWLTLTITP